MLGLGPHCLGLGVYCLGHNTELYIPDQDGETDECRHSERQMSAQTQCCQCPYAMPLAAVWTWRFARPVCSLESTLFIPQCNKITGIDVCRSRH